MEILVIIAYVLSLTLIFIYSLVQLNLARNYIRFHKKHQDEKNEYSLNVDEWPMVTVQLPIFNERYVVERLLDQVVKLEYPEGKLEIQVLDDSTDDTVNITANKIRELQKKGYRIEHVLRANRKGFKAGALADSMTSAKGEFIAIFDSDFLPKRDFLYKTIPHFLKDKNVGVVQTRWGHINREYSLLTKLQAFGLDAHFSVEQMGRNAKQHFINFNGTAGVWRRECINDAGGWQHDTLTEDLDLSFRAQIKGWRFVYLENVESPAELPVTMSALKNQQFRWMKGGAENLRKNSIRLIKSSDTPLRTKLHGLAHLSNSSIFLFIFIVSVLSIPTLFIKNSSETYENVFLIVSVFISSLFILMFYYWQSYKRLYNIEIRSPWDFFRTFFLFLSFTMGLSFHNTVAVLEGYMGKKSSFVRTPKFNIVSSNDSWKGNKYSNKNINLITIIEGVLSLYFLIGVVSAFLLRDFGLFPFHVLLFFGFSSVFYKSLTE